MAINRKHLRVVETYAVPAREDNRAVQPADSDLSTDLLIRKALSVAYDCWVSPGDPGPETCARLLSLAFEMTGEMRMTLSFGRLLTILQTERPQATRTEWATMLAYLSEWQRTP